MMTRLIRFWIAALALMAWSLADAAVTRRPLPEAPQYTLDANHTLPGRAVDDDGGPLAGVAVALHRGSQPVARATTDAAGVFRLVVPVGAQLGRHHLSIGGRTIDCRLIAAPPIRVAAAPITIVSR